MHTMGDYLLIHVALSGIEELAKRVVGEPVVSIVEDVGEERSVEWVGFDEGKIVGVRGRVKGCEKEGFVRVYSFFDE